jgi:hypothetical protein
LNRDGRLVQVGVRASGKDRAHWESTLGVRQVWADECRSRPQETLDAVIEHLRRVGATSVYFSNDIDGTDESYADATGTPEPWGLEPDWVLRLIRRLGSEIGLLGGDIMEVAPPLRQIPRGAQSHDARGTYLRETIGDVARRAVGSSGWFLRWFLRDAIALRGSAAARIAWDFTPLLPEPAAPARVWDTAPRGASASVDARTTALARIAHALRGAHASSQGLRSF